jgi:hypothetical protein
MLNKYLINIGLKGRQITGLPGTVLFAILVSRFAFI